MLNLIFKKGFTKPQISLPGLEKNKQSIILIITYKRINATTSSCERGIVGGEDRGVWSIERINRKEN